VKSFSDGAGSSASLPPPAPPSPSPPITTVTDYRMCLDDASRSRCRMSSIIAWRPSGVHTGHPSSSVIQPLSTKMPMASPDIHFPYSSCSPVHAVSTRTRVSAWRWILLVWTLTCNSGFPGLTGNEKAPSSAGPHSFVQSFLGYWALFLVRVLDKM